jgi:hypothetical protein
MDLIPRQVDYTILEVAQKVVTERHRIWTTYHEVCLSVAKWTTTPLVDGENKATLDVERIRAAVDDFSAKAFVLRKQNKVCIMDRS